jgi:hypothetical protein
MLKSTMLDKYYTKPDIAKKCYDLLSQHSNPGNILLEPSAGNGAFLPWLPKDYLAFDIAPEGSNIIEMDFLGPDLIKYISGKAITVIGNPPFGQRSYLAIKFLNRALEISNLVGFILPISFRKWGIQSKISKNACLIYDQALPDNAFLLDGKDYDARCCFQIWTTDLSNCYSNLRITSRPAISHPDFILYQYNCTESAKKYFDLDWDVAIPRQGFCDYSIRALSEKECDRKRQWMLIKAKGKEILNKILSIDYDALSRGNIGIPGYGKADLVKTYSK